MKKILVIVLVLIAAIGYGQTPTGTKTRFPGVWWQSKDTAAATSADSIVVLANRGDQSLYWRWANSGAWSKIATYVGSGFLPISDTAAMLSHYPLINGQRATGTWHINIAGIADSSVYSNIIPDNTINATYYPVWAGALGTGSNFNNLGYSNSKLTFNPSTGLLTTVALTASGSVTGGTIVKSGGTSSQFLKADGSVDGTAYGTGSVTSVAVSGANGIGVSGSPVTTSGTIALSLSNITPTSVSSSGAITGTTLAGTIQTVAQPNITSVGTLTSLNVSGTAVAGTLSSTTVNATTVNATTLNGTLGTAAQPNITSVGTLSNLTVTGYPMATGYKITGGGVSTATFTTDGGQKSISSSNIASTIITRDANGDFNARNVSFIDVATSKVSASSNVYVNGATSDGYSNLRVTGNIRYSGQIYAADGSASAPSYAFNSSASGMYYPGFDAISLSTVGVQRMTIDASGNIGAPTGTNIYNASDRRLKKNITPIVRGLDAVLGMKPVSFNWIDSFAVSEKDKIMLGFIAQEMEQVVPEAVENYGSDTLKVGGAVIVKPKRINEKFIIPVFAKAIQEQQLQIENLRYQLDELKAILKRNNIQ